MTGSLSRKQRLYHNLIYTSGYTITMTKIQMTKKAFLQFVENCGIEKGTKNCFWGGYSKYANTSSSIEVILENGNTVLPSMVDWN